MEVVRNTQVSRYAQHLATHRHAFGNIQDTMQILQLQTKGIQLNNVERFSIHKEASKNNHILIYSNSQRWQGHRADHNGT